VRSMVAPVSLFALAVTAVVLSACSKRQEPKAVASGRQIYMTNCASCHNTNPNFPGSLGPAIAGSPRELIAARVLDQSYPPGYKPKRTTHLMRKLPWLAPKIGDLEAFLAAAKQDHK
jgi:mono/diheme cytochrome c family protein